VTLIQGTVNSQLDGQPAHVFHHGENWAEPPGTHHLATENTSATEPAKLLVRLRRDHRRTAERR
jgi:quercetin dioxygenase-like cupin family protein